MKKVRFLVILFFIASCTMFGIYMVKESVTADNEAPVISMEMDTIQVEANVTEEQLLEGVKASDKEDGDLTDEIQIASVSRFQNDGSRIVQFIVFDSENILGKAERVINYTDYVSPKIYLKEPLRFLGSELRTKMDSLNIQASDCIDGDLSKEIRVSYGQGIYNVEKGSYPITFQVNNSAGDTCVVEMKLEVVDKEGEAGKYYPLLSDYIVYTQVGKSIKADSYLKGIASENETFIFGNKNTPANIKEESVDIKSNVDYDTPGVYTVEYSYEENKVKATTVLYVVVEG